MIGRHWRRSHKSCMILEACIYHLLQVTCYVGTFFTKTGYVSDEHSLLKSLIRCGRRTNAACEYSYYQTLASAQTGWAPSGQYYVTLVRRCFLMFICCMKTMLKQTHRPIATFCLTCSLVRTWMNEWMNEWMNDELRVVWKRLKTRACWKFACARQFCAVSVSKPNRYGIHRTNNVTSLIDYSVAYMESAVTTNTWRK